MQKKYKAKKSLGQNFLKSIPALNKIIEVGEVSKDDIVLEIGPGKGILTEKLLEKAGRVIAVEKDNELFEFLKNKFSKQINLGTLVLVHDDILKFKNENGDILRNLKYKIIANIPYNITGAILKKFLGGENPSGVAPSAVDLRTMLRASQPELMILMVQKEVAERIIAKDKKESVLSISVKAYGEPKMIMKVPARYFSPSPKVDSAIISIKNISREVFIKNNVNERLFWDIVHAGFAHKRKKLSSNLKKYMSKTFLNSLGNKRAEELTLTDWVNLIKALDINKKE